VLIVDDDQALLEMVSECLASAGYLPLQAANGLDGLKKLDSNAPDMAILDINMPELDGLQTCRLIRAKEKFRSLPILMLTGRGDIKDMIEARKMGADDYLVKPFEPSVLIEKIERLFQR
jgi:two-component system alkaline phosphatase synthesis response regulator PhoP